MTKVVCWNIHDNLHEAWRMLVDMDADVALLQEARSPKHVDGGAVASKVDIGPDEHWDSHSAFNKGRFGSRLYERWPMVVKLSDRVKVEWFKQVAPISHDTGKDEFPVSGIGTAAAARVTPLDGGQPFIAVSMYARWIRWHPSVKSKWGVGNTDVAAHRIISDLSVFIGDFDPSTHRILAAGDLNMTYSPKDDGTGEWARYRTVWDRMDALGLDYIKYPPGPPTYRPTGVDLDHVFASRGFHREVSVRAMNGDDEWGPSDHCRLLIEVNAPGVEASQS